MARKKKKVINKTNTTTLTFHTEVTLKLCHGCDGKGWVAVYDICDNATHATMTGTACFVPTQVIKYAKAVVCPVCSGSGTQHKCK